LLRAAARRFLTLLAAIAAATALPSLVLGLALGVSADRAVSVGLYLVGSFLMITGFFFGNRGPARLKDDDVAPLGPRRVRWATREERVLAINDSAVFVCVGFALIVLGLLVDSRLKLV
jgi:hypothetical protein